MTEEIIASCTFIADTEEEDDIDEEGVIALQQWLTHTNEVHQLKNTMRYLES